MFKSVRFGIFTLNTPFLGAFAPGPRFLENNVSTELAQLCRDSANNDHVLLSNYQALQKHSYGATLQLDGAATADIDKEFVGGRNAAMPSNPSLGKGSRGLPP